MCAGMDCSECLSCLRCDGVSKHGKGESRGESGVTSPFDPFGHLLPAGRTNACGEHIWSNYSILLLIPATSVVT